MNEKEIRDLLDKENAYICPHCKKKQKSAMRGFYCIGKFSQDYEISLETGKQSNFIEEIDEIVDTLNDWWLCLNCRKELPSEITDELYGLC